MPGDDSLEQKLLIIRDRYRSQLPLRIDEIEQAWLECLDNPGDIEKVQILDGLIHTLAGSAGTFDLPLVTEKARAINTEIQSSLLLNSEKTTEVEIQHLQVLIKQLQEYCSEVVKISDG